MQSKKITKYQEDWFNDNRRTIKIIVEFLLLFLATFIGGIMSIIILRAELHSSWLMVLLLIVSLEAIAIIIFWDKYEKPKRISDNKIKRQTRTWGELNNNELKEIKDILKRRLDYRHVGALPHSDE